MQTLAHQRCFTHSLREAAARCPECGHFYCRECIAEHDDRVICAACLKKIATTAERAPRRRLNLRPVVQMCGGFVFVWLLFYIVGRYLVSLPDEFHDENIWVQKFMGAFGMQPDD